MDLPVLPVRRPLFPSQIASIAIGKARSVALIEHVALARLKVPAGRLSEAARSSTDALICVVLVRDPELDGPESLHSVGTLCRLLEYSRSASKGVVYTIALQGLHRIVLTEECPQRLPFLRVVARQLLEPLLEPLRAAALGVTLQSLAQDLLQQLQPPSVQHAASVAASLKNAGSLGAGRNLDSSSLSLLCDALASTVDGEPAEKQAVLECASLTDRADLLIALLKRQLEVVRLSQKIDAQVKGELSRGQRDFYLRRQLKAIEQELGEGEEDKDEVGQLAARLAAAQLPPRVRTVAERELRRLRKMQPTQAEHAVLLSYLEWLCAMPWLVSSQGSLRLSSARRLLDAQHHGLAKVKRRIYEYMAVLSLHAARRAQHRWRSAGTRSRSRRAPRS